MNSTTVLAPVGGRAVALADVPDPVFAGGMVGYGAAIDPPHQVVEVLAPVGGKIVKLLPHAYVIMTAENIGVLVHLGLDTVRLRGAGFTAHVAQGDTVEAGQPVISYDVPAIVAAGYSPVVPVVVMDERDPANVVVGDAVGAGGAIDAGTTLFVASR